MFVDLNTLGSWGGCIGEIPPGPIEICGDDLDNNCNGSVDEGCDCSNGQTKPCGNNVGICQTGTQTCSLGVWGSCVGGIPPQAEICDEIDNDCNGLVDDGNVCLASDTISPIVNSFSISSVVNYNVSDAGGSHLARIEVWVAPDNGGVPGAWSEITSLRKAISDLNLDVYSQSMPYTVPSGTWWFGLHAIDQAGNIGFEPSPIKITNCSATETNCSDWVDEDCDGAIDGADSDCAPPAGTAYYFSSGPAGNPTGNDSNDCLSPATACASLTEAKARINAHPSTDTVTLYFDRGDTWTWDSQNAGTLVSPFFIFSSNPSTHINAYGSGPLPIFDGLVTDFSTVPVHDDTTGPLRWSAFFRIEKGNSSVRNVEIKQTYGHAIFTNNLSDFTLSDSYIHNFGGSAIWHAKPAPVNIVIERNTIHTGQELYRYAKKSSWSQAISTANSGTTTGGNPSGNIIRQNLIYDIYGECIEQNGSIVEKNIIGDCGSMAIGTNPHKMNAGHTIVRYNMIVFSDHASSIYDNHSGGDRACVRVGFDETIPGDNSSGVTEVYGNTCINWPYGIRARCDYVGDNECNPYANIKVYNNTFIDNNVTIDFNLNNGLWANNFEFYNNSSILYDKTSGVHARDYISLPQANFTIDNNLFWTTGGSPTVDSNWQSNIITTDPLLTGEPSIDWDGQTGPNYFNNIKFSDVYPQVGSALIDTGKTLGLGFNDIFLTQGADFSTLPTTVNMQTISQGTFAPWDIGAAIYVTGPVPDTTAPTVNSFSISSVNYTVTDTGGSHLDRVEVWIAPDNNNSPGTWSEVSSLRKTITTQNLDSYTQSIPYTIPNGTWWFGIHAIDQAGNIGYEPSPIKVTNCTVTETNCSDGVDNDCDGLIDGADGDCAAMGDANSRYIDPTATFNGDGTKGTPASCNGCPGAYNSWSSVNFNAANDYYQKCNTSESRTSSVEVNGVTATAVNRMVIGSYRADGIIAACNANEWPEVNVTNTDRDVFRIIGSKYITLENMKSKQGQTSVLIKDSDELIIRNNNLWEGGGQTAMSWGIRYLPTGTTPIYRNIEIYGNYLDTKMAAYGTESSDYLGGYLQDGIAIRGNLDGCSIYGNEIIDGGHTGIWLNGRWTEGPVKNCDVYNNKVTTVDQKRVSRCFSVNANASNNNIHHNYCYNLHESSKAMGNNNNFYNNIFSVQRDYNDKDAQGRHLTLGVVSSDPSLYGTSQNNKVYNNIFYQADNAAIRFTLNTNGTAHVSGHEIVNNIFIDNGECLASNTAPFENLCGSQYTISIKDFGGDPLVEIQDNIFKNNIIYSTSGKTSQIDYYGTTKTVAEFNALNGDRGNIISDILNSNPLFTDAANNIFTLQSTSPAIDAGLNLGATYDDAWNPSSLMPPNTVTTADQDNYGTGWEIGTYVYSAPDTTAPTVNSFSISSVNYNVSDTGGSHLDRVEVWIAPDNGGVPGVWSEVTSLRKTITTQNLNSYTQSIPYTIPNGTWWFGVHAVDQAGNIGFEPSPIKVTNCAATETNCSDGVDNDCDGAIDGADGDCAATGNVYYVSPTGTASWDQCTNINTPCLLSTANTNATAGDLVYLRAGTYTTAISPSNSGTSGNYITFQNYNSETVTFTGTGDVNIIGKNYIKIDGLRFTDTNDEWINLENAQYCIIQNVTCINANKWSGLRMKNADYCQILNNSLTAGTTKGPKGDTILVYNGSDYNFFEGNTVTKGGHACMMIRANPAPSNFNIVKNNVFDNSWWTAFNVNENSYRTIIEHNVFKNAGKDVANNPFSPPRAFNPRDYAAMQNSRVKNSIIRFNKYYNSGSASINSNGDANFDLALGNRFYHNTGYGNYIAFYNNNAYDQYDNIFSNNIFGKSIEYPLRKDNSVGKNKLDYWYGNCFDTSPIKYLLKTGTLDQVKAQYPAHFPDNSNIAADPLFTDENNYDFTLKSQSPLIDSGVFLTKTANSGTGTQISLEDSSYFSDGYGIIEGDLIQLQGDTKRVRIVLVNDNTNIITIDSPLTWTTGQGVTLAYQGSAPDIGAYEYGTCTPSTEICDGIDNDCDGQTDEGCNKDNDSYCDCGMIFTFGSDLTGTCSGTNTTDNNWWNQTCDCDDMKNYIYPGATETCDNNDNDCDGQIDEGCDDDNDDYCDDSMTFYNFPVTICPNSNIFDGLPGNDCNDNIFSINPTATENCTNGIDDDCDGQIDGADSECGVSCIGNEIWVQAPVTSTTINTAIASASPGDCVIVPDGTYVMGVELGDAIHIPSTVDCAETNPCTLRTATPGGVTITGNPNDHQSIDRTMLIEGDWWVIKDFRFDNIDTGNSSIRPNGVYTNGTTGVRITNNYFGNFFASCNGTVKSWMVWDGNPTGSTNTRIDHNKFENIHPQSIQVDHNSTNTLIDYNHFDHFSELNYTGIQIGSGSSSTFKNTDTIIEYNLFENSANDGVHSKSSYNTTRYNVFRNCKAMVFRGGHYSKFHDNYVFNGTTVSVRISGSNHKVYNNYIENSQYTAIEILKGGPNYLDVVDLLVANNTIVDSRVGIDIGREFVDTPNPPKNLTFKNNIIVAGNGDACVRDRGHTGDFIWENNLHYTTGTGVYWNNMGGGNEPGLGITHADPNLMQGPYIKRLQSSSINAIGKGTPDVNVTDDIDGHSRDAVNPDIGADEYSGSAPVRLPITVSEVGPTW